MDEHVFVGERGRGRTFVFVVFVGREKQSFGFYCPLRGRREQTEWVFMDFEWSSSWEEGANRVGLRGRRKSRGFWHSSRVVEVASDLCLSCATNDTLDSWFYAVYGCQRGHKMDYNISCDFLTHLLTFFLKSSLLSLHSFCKYKMQTWILEHRGFVIRTGKH
ncbi:uncharacterized protein LOC108988845 [Juglans regia]|uniref:Uncharacterized protein LOC108988845 n=1 Tax=Juglans regia TaxID=51240 RepID=A0A6P9EEZ5_JUGRE|nr:uncharacterized protein LOC108988845 [Juglans regia]